MFRIIDTILVEFRGCFSREAAFVWFTIVMTGFLVRLDHDGVSSFIRWLFINPQFYDPMLHFFRAESWKLESLLDRWLKIVMSRFPIPEFNGRPLLIGDTIKISKEAKKMPAVKSLHQDSNNSGKPETIRGHHFGFVGLLVGLAGKIRCVPLQGELQEGVDEIHPSEGLNGNPPTLITRMARLLVAKAQQTGRVCYATLDAYYAVGPTFLVLREALNEKGKQWVHVITRAKDNTVAFFDWSNIEKKFQEKHKVILKDVFDSPSLFTEAQIEIYGRTRTIRYYCLDLLWKPIKGLLRFVLVMDGNERFILMSSDITLDPVQIITIYSHRASIEYMFLTLKHLLGGFCYHFWTRAFPEIKRGQTFSYETLDSKQKELYRDAAEAVERFVNLAAIALGLLHYLAFTYPVQILEQYQGWLRTYPKNMPSEGMVRSVLQSEWFSIDRKDRFSRTLRTIEDRSREPAPRPASCLPATG